MDSEVLGIDRIWQCGVKRAESWESEAWYLSQVETRKE